MSTKTASAPASASTLGQTAQVQPYLFFDGRCEEALEFYRQAVGAQIGMKMRFGDSPEAPPPGMPTPPANKIMHADFTVGGSMILASDGECNGKPGFQGFSLALSVKTDAEAERAFAALAAGGQVGMPLSKTFFSPKFGMLTDKFGIGWMVMVSSQIK